MADAVVDTLDPIRKRYRDLEQDPAHIRAVLRDGARQARERAAAEVETAREAIGLLPT